MRGFSGLRLGLGKGAPARDPRAGLDCPAPPSSCPRGQCEAKRPLHWKRLLSGFRARAELSLLRVRRDTFPARGMRRGGEIFIAHAQRLLA